MSKIKVKQKKEAYVCHLSERQKYIVQDEKHNSKAFVPIQIDAGNFVEVVQVDGGLITGLPKGSNICDNLIYTIKDCSMGLNITWFFELKGTKNEHEAKHSIDQILESIQYMQDQVMYPQAEKYIKNRDYVFAAVAGAPDKTLPVINNKSLRMLCRKLQAISGKGREVKDMFTLFFYIKPNKNCMKAEVKKNAPPYDILCYNNRGGYIQYPSMLKKLLT